MLTRPTNRVRQISHHKNHFLLRIKSFREKDYGSYTCGYNLTRQRYGHPGQVEGSIEISGERSFLITLAKFSFVF